MKRKFVLTEEESKRILSLHKDKIQENKDTRIPLNEAVWDRVRNEISSCKYVKDKPTMSDSQLNKLAYNIKNWPSDVMWSADILDRSSILGRSKKAAKWVAYQIYQTKNKGNFCRMIRLYDKNFADDYFFEDYDNAFDGDVSFSILSQAVNKVMGIEGKEETQPTPTPTPTKKGCPSIVKSFTDAGYTQITEKRYKELAGNNTRVRKYKYCPVTKKNLYFAKPKATETGPAPTPVPEEGGGGTSTTGGKRYPFDYNTVLAAINKKCPGGGGGGTSPEEEEDMINPFGQGEQTPAQVITITDKLYSGI